MSQFAQGLALGQQLFQEGKRLYNDPRARQAATQLQAFARGALARKSRKAKYMSRKRQMQKVGEEPGSALSKYNQNRSDGFQLRNSDTLYPIDLLAIPRNTQTSDGLNTRERDIIYLTGIKICLTVDTQIGNLYFNVACVSAKNRGIIDGTDLFRSYNGETRQINFDDGTLNALDRHCLPINADEFTVHFHDRKLLMTGADASEYRGKKVGDVYAKDYWVPVRRQIRFEGNEAQSETRFSLIYWFGVTGDTIAASQTPTANVAKIEWKTVAVFKEPSPVYKFTK